MQNKLEKLIKIVYQNWKAGQAKIKQAHPDEEALTCFLESRLSEEEALLIKTHLTVCQSCAEAFAIQLKLKLGEEQVPKELVELAKNLVKEEAKIPFLEIVLSLKEKTLELLHTTGDVLVGQELMPAPVLRSRQIKDFKDEVTILKDFKDIRVEIKIENKQAKAFDLTVMVKEKATQKTLKDLRVTLLKDNLELESYLTDSGKVIFEHVLLGKYKIEISDIEKNLASVLVEIKTP